MTSTAQLFLDLQSPNLPDVLIQDHLARMDPTYFERHPLHEIRSHLTMLHRLGPDNLAEVRAESLDAGEWRVTVVAFDYMAEFAIISGLLSAAGLSILDGDVYTYTDTPPEPSVHSHDGPPTHRHRRPRRSSPPPVDVASPPLLTLRKIVDTFHVRAIHGAQPEWTAFERDLEAALRLLKSRRYDEARAQINLRVIDYLRRAASPAPEPLYPVHITVDTTTSPTATLLHIQAQDTPAFLYAFSNALAMRGIYIVHVAIETLGDEVRDTLAVTDREGAKIIAPEKIWELRFVVALIKQFTHLLTGAPDPPMALAHFNQLIDKILANVKSGRAIEETCLFLERRHVISALAKLFGTSDFLWEDFLRMQHTALFPVLQDIDAISVQKSRDQMARELAARLSRVSGVDRKKELLNRYKDREMFRIDMRQILAKIESFTDFSRELTDLAEVVVNAAYRLCDGELHQRYGQPMTPSGDECGLCICALGKCGGRELGWASDIELLFVYAEQGDTTGPHRLLSSEYFERLVRAIIDSIVARREGIFQIDLRLRPYGSKGALACSLAHFREYFNDRGGAIPYERQALIKLRPIGGALELGRRVEQVRDAFVFSQAPLDLKELTHLRERQNNELVAPHRVNVKYSYGGLIDIEYYVQYLQILHGVDAPQVRSPNTLEALTALHQAGHILQADYQTLTEAYIFLRRLINALRIVRGNAKDLVLPDPASQEFRFLARRLGYAEDRGTDPANQLLDDVLRHMGHAGHAYRTRFLPPSPSGTSG